MRRAECVCGAYGKKQNVCRVLVKKPKKTDHWKENLGETVKLKYA